MYVSDENWWLQVMLPTVVTGISRHTTCLMPVSSVVLTHVLYLNTCWANRNRCQEDLKQPPPLGELVETPLYYVDEDYPVGPEIQ